MFNPFNKHRADIAHDASNNISDRYRLPSVTVQYPAPHTHMSMNIIHRGIYTETRGLFQPIAQILIYKPNRGRSSLGMYGMKLETTIAPSNRSVLSLLCRSSICVSITICHRADHLCVALLASPTQPPPTCPSRDSARAHRSSSAYPGRLADTCGHLARQTSTRRADGRDLAEGRSSPADNPRAGCQRIQTKEWLGWAGGGIRMECGIPRIVVKQGWAA